MSALVAQVSPALRLDGPLRLPDSLSVPCHDSPALTVDTDDDDGPEDAKACPHLPGDVIKLAPSRVGFSQPILKIFGLSCWLCLQWDLQFHWL